MKPTGYTRSVANTTAVVAETLVLSATGIATYPFSPSGRAYLGIARFWARSVFRLAGVSLHVEGLERVDFGRPQVLMCNHQSHTDILALFASIPTPIRFIAKKQLGQIPVFGWGMRIADFVLIDRADRRQALRSIDLAAEKIARGHTVVIFPEGTRSPDGSLQAFKKGGFVLAERAHVPIVPVGIVGTYAVLPKHSLLIQSSDVTVRFGETIQTDGVPRAEFMKRTHAAISELSRGAAEAAAASGRVPARLLRA
jgi:1-acyl-sn-glycerol-3-phosphate acyltransferase